MSLGGNYVRADETCPDCGGDCWRNSHTIVCEDCYSTLGTAELTNGSVARAWDHIHRERPTYRSGVPRCVGGFEDAYPQYSD